MTQDTREVSNTREKGKSNGSLQTEREGIWDSTESLEGVRTLGQPTIKKYKFTNKLCICIS